LVFSWDAPVQRGNSCGSCFIGLQEAGCNGGAITNEASATNNAIFSGSYGTFDINAGSGAVGATPNLFDSFFGNAFISSGTGTINVFITASGLNSPRGSSVTFTNGFTSNEVPAGWTVTEQTFLDSANGIFTTTTPLASAIFKSIGSGSQNSIVNTGSGPYSITEEYTIIASGAGLVNDTIDVGGVSSAPIPSALPLFGSALALMWFCFFRRKTNA
jgi:hypothetical protein